MISSILTTATVNEVTTSVLRVITAEPWQYGDYLCKASNKIGSAEARVNLFGEWKFRSLSLSLCVFAILIFDFTFSICRGFFVPFIASLIYVHPWQASAGV